jgi:hypothetical protein
MRLVRAFALGRPFRELDEPIGILTAPQLLDNPKRDDIRRFSSHDDGSKPER